MSSTRLEAASEALLRVLETPEPERERVLEHVCAGDAELLLEVRSLLRHHHAGFLERPPSPDRVGPYRVLRELGRGGMGVVYEAEQEFPRRRVALKVIRQELLTEDADLRFGREAEILARLQHPGIAQLFAAGRADTPFGPQPFLAMELVEGRFLDDYAAEKGLDLDARLALGLSVVDAVAHAHERGIVHRDLKPENVLVDEHGCPRVLDFGIARLLDPESRVATLQLGTGVLLGTLPYMSPEQASGGSARVDPRSDVYSLGVVLHELLTGELPLALDDLPLFRMAESIRNEPPTPLRRVLPEADADLETILLTALEKDPERRYWCAGDLALDLRRLARREPILARRPTTAYRLRCFAQRNRALVLGFAAVFMTLLAGAVVAGVGFWNARERSREVLQLSAVTRLRELETEASDAWPVVPARRAAYLDWTRRAEELLAELPEHGRSLAQLRERADRRAGDSFRFDDDATQWWHDTLAALIADLERFADPDPFVGARASVFARLALLDELERASSGAAAEAWRSAIEAIADPARSPAYHGLRLEPQFGLLPLTQDPDSGLWEFAHLASGPPAEIDAQGRTRLAEESGIVLVLIPGGAYAVGAQVEDPSAPFYDARSLHRERTLQTADLSPFFIGKHELTRSQWRRAMGTDPSAYPEGADYGSGPIGGDRPVENVSWHEAAEALRRLGLVLPTEVQWEVAARAGSTFPWWTGADPSSLIGAANLADLFARDHKGSDDWPYETWLDDGSTIEASVTTGRANAFGLHAVHGNVAEWCRDPRSHVADPPRPGDGERPQGNDWGRRVARGGSFSGNADAARIAARRILDAGARSDDIGMRPARALDTPR